MSLKRVISLNLMLSSSFVPSQSFPYPIYVCTDREVIIEKIIFDFAQAISDSNINYAFWKIINVGKDGLGMTVLNWITNNNIDYPNNYKNMTLTSGLEIVLLEEHLIRQNEALIFDKEIFGNIILTNTNRSTVTIFERRK